MVVFVCVCVCMCVFYYSSLSYDDFRQPFSEVFFLGICGFKDAERRCSSRFISTLRSALQGFLMIIACIKLGFWCSLFAARSSQS